LNNDSTRLIILSYAVDIGVTPPLTAFRVYCLWNNGSNWNNINVFLEGTLLDQQDPGISISEDF